MSKTSVWKNIFMVLFCVAVVVFLVTQLFSGSEKPAVEPAASEELQANMVGLMHPDVEYMEPEDSYNYYMDLPMVYKTSTMKTYFGDEVPDIMSEEIMKTNYRKVTTGEGENTQEIHMTGPKIVINNYELPESAFYVCFDYYMDEAEYYICPACFAQCGFEKNSDVALTCYDDAVLAADHLSAIPVDQLEIHTTWILNKYDSETNTYYFSVTQDGPFSGISDVFSTYTMTRRYNTMPKDDSVIGYQKVPYSILNDYWSKYDMSRNKLRVRMNRLYNTEYEQLSFDKDGRM